MKKYVKSSRTTYTQKQLKEMANNGIAIDITDDDNIKITNKEVVGISHGQYGMNGALIKDRTTGQLYVVTQRNSNLYRLV